MSTLVSISHHLLLILLLLLLTISSSKSDDSTSPAIIATICGKNQSKDAEAFDVNFVNAMEIIFQNITKSGFGVSVSGNSNIVYGLGQCFNYLSPTDCQLCYAQSRLKLPHCLPATDSRIYLDGCFLRYSDHNVSTEAIDASDTYVCGNSTASMPNSTQLDNLVTTLLNNLTSRAYASEDYYQVGSSIVSQGVMVYGMAQCWRSLNATGCKDCLENAKKNVVKCLPAEDGKAMNAGCFMRYSKDPFYLTGTSGNGGSSSVRKKLGIALGLTAVALAVVGLVVLWLKMRSKTSSTDDVDGSGEIIRSIAASSLNFKYEDLRKATDYFNQNNKIGQGGYGSVYKGILLDGREIAVKRLFINTRQNIEQFFNEVTLVSQIRHKNLAKLLGCSVEGPESILVYEYLCNTSLDSFLFDAFKKNSLDWERRFDIIVGTAEGLSYLHTESEVRIIHRDIKASNILLDEKFKPKIADFGLARYFMEDQSHLSTGLAGTFGYMAPEYIVHGQLSEKADIYSYGIVVLEIITGRRNSNSIASSDEGHSLMSLIWQHFNSGKLIEMLDPCLQEQCSEEQALKVFHVGLLCAQALPNLRPPMWKVVEMLNSRLDELPLPTQPPFIHIKNSSIQINNSATSSNSSTSKSPFSLNKISGSSLQAR
ncbi:cysteine-rich receptor-like protein kinase 2 [Typha angustifolia]|uniref:cysteine-rich receptor-like protein kinase 2 n=1 Tax=Typha angustifolia TaxID=59011 RepID=UPI003C2C7DD5